MWDYDKNQIEIDDAKIYMSESVHFKCKNGHSFSRTIKKFVQNQECPICTIDSVAKYPKLIKQWDYKKNKEFDINLTPASSKLSVWWR